MDKLRTEPSDAPVGGVPDASSERETSKFVRDHIGWMWRLAQRYLADATLAEDAVQNAFNKVFANLDQFEGKSSIRAWMRSIVVNEALIMLRKRRSLNEDANIDPLLPEFDENDCRIEAKWVESPTPEQLLMTKESRQQVLEAIDKLPDIYRLTLLLRDIEGQSTAEVAQALGISEASVKTRLHRARAALKTLLEPYMRKGTL